MNRWLIGFAAVFVCLAGGGLTAQQVLTIAAGFDVTDRNSTGFYIDESIAAGATNLVIANNGGLTIRTKTGDATASATLASFFNPVLWADEFPFDVRVLFDQLSSRFFVVAGGRGCGDARCSHVLIAVSRTASPPGLGSADWMFFALDATLDNSTPTSYWADFPSLGISEDAVAVTMQMFPWDEPGTTFNKVLKIRVLKKSQLLGGTVTSWTDFSGFTDPQNAAVLRAALQPAQHFNGGTTLLTASLSQAGCGYVIVGVDHAATAPVITTRRVASQQPCQQAADAPQPDGKRPLFNAGGLRTPLVVRDGSLWLARSIARTNNGVTSPGIYWAQINVANWPTVTLVQEGTLDAQGAALFYPALAVDRLGRMAMIYARSGSTEYPSLYVTGRIAGDPAGTLRPPLLLKAGEVSLDLPNDSSSPQRFADYFGAAIDPAEDAFWFSGEYVRTPATGDRWAGKVLFTDGFTDGTLAAGDIIRAVHISEARQRIDALRQRFSLTPFVWTDASLVAGSTTIRVQHLLELRSALLQLYAAAGRPAPEFSATVAAGLAIRALHIRELRDAIIAVE